MALPRASQSDPSKRSSESISTPTKQRREASVYDAIAGRITTEGFLSTHPTTSRYRDTQSHSTRPLPPEEVLFRRKRARSFYGDDDPYWGGRYPTPDRKLPDSDLLKAIHSYTSDFYSRAIGVDYQSIDEMALLGLGVSLEEMADKVLGETGDLDFTEGEANKGKGKSGGAIKTESESKGDKREINASASSIATSGGENSESIEERRPKRRKRRYETDDDG